MPNEQELSDSDTLNEAEEDLLHEAVIPESPALLTEREASEIELLFHHFDADADGEVTRDDFKRSLMVNPLLTKCSVDKGITEGQLDALWKSMDVNSNGTLDVTEFTDKFHELASCNLFLWLTIIRIN